MMPDNPAATDRQPAVRPAPPAGQLSLFGADVVQPRPVDLEGLLAGPGQVVRLGGTARISVVVDQAWRARALLAEFARRGLTGTGERTGAGSEDAAVAGHIGVRTAFSASLAPVAARWLRGALTLPPDDFELNGPMLRMWYIAAGHAQVPRVSGLPSGESRRSTQSVTLRLSITDESGWPAIRVALARAGLPAELVGPRAGGPGYRIGGRRLIARFAELIGTRPEAVPVEAWPRIAPRRIRSAPVSSPTVTGSGVSVTTGG